tara:strand:+ start:711 stop:1031 length:321 start_codon:yes stop_codon:yes gene_type:complete
MKKWLLGILAAIGGILTIILGIGKNKRVKEIKSKIKDNESKVKDIDSKLKSTEKRNEAIKKSLKNKEQTVEEIEKQREMFFESRRKQNQDADDASKFLKKYANKKK